MVLFNSSGGPDQFSIAGGPGRPGDIPRGVPTAVSMIHSFSAADPLDPQTIAGRWLDQGAFVYFGSVWEPFLLGVSDAPAGRRSGGGRPSAGGGSATRRIGAVRLSLAAGLPGRPAVSSPGAGHREARPAGRQGRSRSSERLSQRPAELGRAQSRDDDRSQVRESERLTPNDWRKATPTNDDWPVIEIDPAFASSIQAFPPGDRDSDRKRLIWCLNAAIGELLGPRPKSPPLTPGGAAKTISGTNRPAGWRTVLREVRRDRLDSRERPVFDELLIDALGEIGGWDELQARLERVSAGGGWCAGLGSHRDVCDRPARAPGPEPGPIPGLCECPRPLGRSDALSWPDGWKFPAQFTERVSALVRADRSRRLEPWLDRLRRTGDALAVLPGRRSQAATISAEQAPAQAQLGKR